MSKDYFKTDSKTIDFDNAELVTEMYNQGFVFTRLGKGLMNQTRSLRIDLSKFTLTSENRRILRNSGIFACLFQQLPMHEYNWKIHKLGKEFYEKKFGDGTMSASKIKEMITDMEKSNMNCLFSYQIKDMPLDYDVGYSLGYANNELLHYAYPFYDLSVETANIGLSMMLWAIQWAENNNKKYVYLGSVVDQSAKYKLQFNGLQWWNTETKQWSEDISELKTLLG